MTREQKLKWFQDRRDALVADPPLRDHPSRTVTTFLLPGFGPYKQEADRTSVGDVVALRLNERIGYPIISIGPVGDAVIPLAQAMLVAINADETIYLNHPYDHSET